MGIQRPDGIVITGSPWAQYERVDVVFPSTPNTDLTVRYSKLSPTDPTTVDYVVVRRSGAGNIYNDHSASRKVWQQGFIVLRSDVGSLKASLLLVVPRLTT